MYNNGDQKGAIELQAKESQEIVNFSVKMILLTYRMSLKVSMREMKRDSLNLRIQTIR